MSAAASIYAFTKRAQHILMRVRPSHERTRAYAHMRDGAATRACHDSAAHFICFLLVYLGGLAICAKSSSKPLVVVPILAAPRL
eukprot:scaffold92273_cov41-Tisochrysis_lutea.AAC.3